MTVDLIDVRDLVEHPGTSRRVRLHEPVAFRTEEDGTPIDFVLKHYAPTAGAALAPLTAQSSRALAVAQGSYQLWLQTLSANVVETIRFGRGLAGARSMGSAPMSSEAGRLRAAPPMFASITRSLAPPGANPTRKRMGFSGYLSCGEAPMAIAGIPAQASVSSVSRFISIKCVRYPSIGSALSRNHYGRK